MYCPDCGIEERQANQFCRACGADLRRVRDAIATTDSVTASAASAREEIGRAVAAKIRETQSTYDLKKVAEDILPQIEKFLESPEEKRLRRVRTGSIIGSAGLGTAIALTIVSLALKNEEMFFLAGLGLVAFFIGLGFVLNGLFLTTPKKGLNDKSSDAESQRQLDGVGNHTNDLRLAEPPTLFSSVTEHTTHHLKEKQSLPRD